MNQNINFIPAKKFVFDEREAELKQLEKAGKTISLLFILSQVTSANQNPLSQVSSSR